MSASPPAPSAAIRRLGLPEFTAMLAMLFATIAFSIDAMLPAFFYLPFEHSEDMADQELSVTLFNALGGDWVKYADEHHEIIKRFGRFPHRNPQLGRETTPEERQFLEGGGFAG